MSDTLLIADGEWCHPYLNARVRNARNGRCLVIILDAVMMTIEYAEMQIAG